MGSNPQALTEKLTQGLRAANPTERFHSLAGLVFNEPDQSAVRLAELEPVVRELCNDPDASMCNFAPWALDLLFDPDGCRRLPERLAHADWRVRFRTLVLFVKYYDPSRDVDLPAGLGEALAALLRDEHSRIRRLAFFGLGLLGESGRRFEDAIVAAIPRRVRQHPDDSIARSYAARALKMIGAHSEPSVAALIELLAADGEWQEDAAIALGFLGSGAPPEAVEWLELAAAQPGPVRIQALLALANVAPKRALAALQAPSHRLQYEFASRQRRRQGLEPRRVMVDSQEWPVAERIAWSTGEGLADYLQYLCKMFGAVSEPAMSIARFVRWRQRSSSPDRQQYAYASQDYYDPHASDEMFQSKWQLAFHCLARRRRITRYLHILDRLALTDIATQAGTGHLAHHQLELAAYAGNSAARAYLGVSSGAEPRKPRDWYCGVARFGHEAMTRAHLALGYLVWPIFALQESGVDPGVALLEIEMRLRQPSEGWTAGVHASLNYHEWDKETSSAAGWAIKYIPVAQRESEADAKVFDHGLLALTGTEAPMFRYGSFNPGECADGSLRWNWKFPHEPQTCPSAAAPELIQRMVGSELALWALGIVDPLSESVHPG